MYTTVGKAGFITAFYIIIVPILGLFLGKKCGLSVWISVVIALAGLYFLCITDGFSIGKGDIYVFLGAIAFSIHILVIDYFTQFNDGVKMSCIQFFICGILCFVPMMLFEHPEISMILLAWKPILYAGVMSCGVAYTLQIVGQKNMNPTVASLILSSGICDLCDRWLFSSASEFEPITDYGILKERFCALATDGIRAKILEEQGYDTQILEFIDMEHTPKNLLIRVCKDRQNQKI